ncbi:MULTISPECIES: hypothetical protein [Kaistia]|uniref:Uncharacterized protein n=1 Tax=Kaistia nematophila TaxID=2994654 RepID=A0A9X3ILW1_9HYPH|nr:hypothetical protein [Kaistia nematophila]MBN9025398.1 hypothetical protein [Hyphomicrobiales bacterium]MCX5570287.1 hypothetical protein [Kaistia nematophila]
MTLARPIDSQPAVARRSPNWKWISIAIATIGILGLFGANAHLVYVALRSQPECVAHTKATDGSGSAYSAAKSAC